MDRFKLIGYNSYGVIVIYFSKKMDAVLKKMELRKQGWAVRLEDLMEVSHDTSRIR